MSDKTLCEWEGRIEDKLDKFRKIVEDPKYACCRCARVANKKKHLCKPISLKTGK